MAFVTFCFRERHSLADSPLMGFFEMYSSIVFYNKNSNQTHTS